ncbi:hypothetical protein CsatB_000549 [Cannabis sativa]
MGSLDRLFNRQRSVHEILGGGLVADVILWRQKNVTVGILLVTLAAWVVFEKSGYTLLSLLSSVFLLLIVILFIWAKSAAILNRLSFEKISTLASGCHVIVQLSLNRPSPPLPELHLSEEMVNEMASFIRIRVNNLLRVSQDIALGKDSKLFFKVAGYLCLISFVGGMTDFLTLAYTSLVIILTIPALYERYEAHIDKFIIMEYRRLQQLYAFLDEKCFSKLQKWVVEKRKLS